MTILKAARYDLIEKTAGDIAGAFYEQGRSLGLHSQYKNARQYAKAKFKKYIPVALEVLTALLDRKDISEHMKNTIYEAILERANDPELAVFDKPKTKNGISVIQDTKN